MKAFEIRTIIATILFCLGFALVVIFIDYLAIWGLGTLLILASIVLYLRRNTSA